MAQLLPPGWVDEEQNRIARALLIIQVVYGDRTRRVEVVQIISHCPPDLRRD